MAIFPGFLHEVRSTPMHCLDRQFDGSPRGHHNDGQSAVYRLNLRKYFQPFASRCRIAAVVEIEQDGVEISSPDGIERFGGRLYEFRVKPIALQEQANSHEYVVVVFGNQHSPMPVRADELTRSRC